MDNNVYYISLAFAQLSKNIENMNNEMQKMKFNYDSEIQKIKTNNEKMESYYDLDIHKLKEKINELTIDIKKKSNSLRNKNEIDKL